MANIKERIRTVGNAVYNHPGRVVAFGFAIPGIGIGDAIYADNLADPAIAAAKNNHPISVETQQLIDEGVIFGKPDYYGIHNYPQDSGPIFIDIAKLQEFNAIRDPDVMPDQAFTLAQQEIERDIILTEVIEKAHSEAIESNLVIAGQQAYLT